MARAGATASWLNRCGAAVVAGAVLVLGSAPAAGAGDWATDGPRSFASCTYRALVHAVALGGTVTFGCHGTIDFAKPIVVSKRAVTLDASGEAVVLDGDLLVSDSSKPEAHFGGLVTTLKVGK